MICNQPNTCFARTATGKCGILTGDQYPEGKCKFQKPKAEEPEYADIDLQKNRPDGNPLVQLNIDRIEERRMQMEMSKEDMSARCGMCRNWYQTRIEHGGGSTYKSAERLASLLRVSIEEICYEK